MKDYEELFSSLLRKRIKEKIVGSVYTRVRNDNLIVRINSFDLYYETSYDNFADRFLNGFTPEKCYREVLDGFGNEIQRSIQKYYVKEKQELR